jgi:hypothetical protein
MALKAEAAAVVCVLASKRLEAFLHLQQKKKKKKSYTPCSDMFPRILPQGSKKPTSTYTAVHPAADKSRLRMRIGGSIMIACY